MIQPAQARRKWLPRSGVVAENLVVVAGDLPIPAISKLNAMELETPSENTATINLPKSR
jgi:hypothetical protein